MDKKKRNNGNNLHFRTNLQYTHTADMYLNLKVKSTLYISPTEHFEVASLESFVQKVHGWFILYKTSFSFKRQLSSD